MVKKTLSLLFIAVLVVSLLLGCGGGGGELLPTEVPTGIPTIMPNGTHTPINLIEVVPQKADMMALIDLSRIIEDEAIAELWEAMPLEPGDPQTVDELLELTMEETGLDLRDFGQGLMFGDMPETDEEMEYLGILVKGTFEESDLIATIESQSGEPFTTINYQGYRIYTDAYGEVGIAFLGSDALVIAPMEVVEDVIDVRRGDRMAVSGNLLDMYNGLGDSLLKVAIVVPPGVVEEALQGITAELPAELPIDLPPGALDALADIETAGVSLAKNWQSIVLTLRMCFSSIASAEDVEDLINGVILFAPMMPDIPAEALELLEAVDVSLDGSCLDISLEMTTSEIMGLIEESSAQPILPIQPIQPILPLQPQLP